MKYAAIDIGTNAARLLIGEVCKEGKHPYVKKISYTRIPLRLGNDVFDLGEISPAKQIQFEKSMQAFALISETFEVKRLRACATSAMRESRNGQAVIQSIFEKSGIEIEIISGDEEARLIFGTFFLLDFDKSSSFIVIDVGGGSTEISVFEAGKKIAAKSFEIGTVRLLKDKVQKSVWKELENWIETHVDMNDMHKIFATGGNINKIHKILGAQENEALSLHKFKKLSKKLAALSYDERLETYQLKPDRADVIVPACQIYDAIFETLQCKEFFVPKIGLSDGMIYDMYLEDEK